jgi:hypothetical protein
MGSFTPVLPKTRSGIGFSGKVGVTLAACCFKVVLQAILPAIAIPAARKFRRVADMIYFYYNLKGSQLIVQYYSGSAWRSPKSLPSIFTR